MKQKLQEKEDLFKNLESLDGMRNKLEELQKQMAWALVRPSSLITPFSFEMNALMAPKSKKSIKLNCELNVAGDRAGEGVGADEGEAAGRPAFHGEIRREGG